MQHDVLSEGEGTPTRAQLAAQRRLGDRPQAALDEVDRILDAGLAVLQRVAPRSPRVTDIVAEAGTSNQTFYRCFASKDELILAIMERGIARLVTYVRHQMDKEAADQPDRRMARWVEAILAQVTNPDAASASLAATAELGRISGQHAAQGMEVLTPLQDLLLEPLAAAGSTDIDRDAAALYEVAFGTMRRFLYAEQRPSKADIAHLVAFSLRAITR
jgi:AcrR family transcriptional regulator